MTAPSEPDLDLPARWGILAGSLTLGALGLLAWGVVSGISKTDSGNQKAAATVLLVLAALAWVAWVLVRSTRAQAAVASCLVVMAMMGGALAAFAPVAAVFPAVAAVAAASRWAMPPAATIGVVGWLSVAAAAALNHSAHGIYLGALAAIFAGLIVGLSRRQAVERTEQLARLELASERAEVQRTRAEVLAERNHVARELHDVLAHTLAALSVQLEAFKTVVDAEPHASAAVRDQLDRSRALVREGLDEARGAVRALRDDAQPLPERLAVCSQQHGAAFSVSGSVRALAPEVVLALYRITQEALTNVVKHAPGSSASVRLCYEDRAVTVTVDDVGARTGSPSPLGASGGGFGLQGMGERLASLGGHVAAGPTPQGWRVVATVPTGAAAPRAGDPLVP